MYGTLWLLLIAYTTRALPYGLRYSYAGSLQVQRDLEESASVSGAGFGTVFRRVVLPLISPSVMAAWLFVFLTTARELSIALILSGPRSQMVSTAVFNLYNAGGTPALGAIGFVYAGVMAAFATLFYFVTKKSGISVGQA